MIDASSIQEIKEKSDVDQVKIDELSQKYALNSPETAPFDETRPRGRRFHKVSCQK